MYVNKPQISIVKKIIILLKLVCFAAALLYYKIKTQGQIWSPSKLWLHCFQFPRRFNFPGKCYDNEFTLCPILMHKNQLAPPSMTTNERKLYNTIKGKYSRMRSGLSFVWSELPYKLQSRQAIDINSIFLTFPPCCFSASMHRRDDVRPSLSKCRQVATTGQLCGGLSGMCGVPAFGHTKKCFFASGNWCKVSRYCIHVFLIFDFNCVF